MAWRCLTRSRSNNKGSSTVVPVLSDGENYNDNGGNSSGTDGNNNGNRNNVNEIIGSSSSNNTGSSCGSSGGNHLKAKDDPLLKDYFRMLRVGVPADVVSTRMRGDKRITMAMAEAGLPKDFEALLEVDPDALSPLGSSSSSTFDDRSSADGGNDFAAQLCAGATQLKKTGELTEHSGGGAATLRESEEKGALQSKGSGKELRQRLNQAIEKRQRELQLPPQPLLVETSGTDTSAKGGDADRADFDCSFQGEQLGTGRFATVFACSYVQSAPDPAAIMDADEEFGVRKACALKKFRIAPTQMDDPPVAVLSAWQCEYAALVSLPSHPHLVQLLAASAGRASNDTAELSQTTSTEAKLIENGPHAPWLALELCDGGCLNDLLAALGRALERRDESSCENALASSQLAVRDRPRVSISFPLILLDVLRDVARGLIAMHSCGWAHLDLKDHNIFLSSSTSSLPNGNNNEKSTAGIPSNIVAKLGDFGSAKPPKARDRVASVANSSLPPLPLTVVATSGWAAPELLHLAEVLEQHRDSSPTAREHPTIAAAESAVGPSADIFSFGILLWTCLAAASARDAKAGETRSEDRSAIGAKSVADWLRVVGSNPLSGLAADECLKALNRGVRPTLPTDSSNLVDVICDNTVLMLCELAISCWEMDPSIRPSALEVAAKLDAVFLLCLY